MSAPATTGKPQNKPDSDFGNNLGQNADNNPYVGPHPFQPEQSHLFFGREREASELLALVIANRVVLFFAQSGAGKTSLLNARLIPELQGKGFEVLPTGRVGGELPTKFAVANIFVFNLMAYLNQVSSGESQLGDAGLAQIPLSDFLVHLGHVDGKWVYAPGAEEDASSVDDAPTETIKATLAGMTGAAIEPPPSDADLAIQPRILIVDQFEEILTSHPEAWEQRADFFTQLRQALDEDPYLWVLLSMREDFVGALSPYAHLLPDGLRVRYHMQPMDEKSALAAVKQPAALYGHEFAPGVAELLTRNLRQIENHEGSSEARLTKEPVNDLTKEPAEDTAHEEGTGETAARRLGQFVEPVQLQVVCRQLWESITSPPGTPIGMDDLQKLAGGAGPEEFVNDALRVYYEQSLALALAHAPESVTERSLRNWFDQVVITPEGKRNLLHQADADTEGMPNEVVKTLVDRFILRRETRSDRRWIELAHDRFVEPIRRSNRQWFAREPSPTLALAQIWFSGGKDPTLLLAGSKLAEAAARLEAHPNEFLPLEQEFIKASEEFERKETEKRRRFMITVLTAGVLILLAFSALLLNLWSSEKGSREDADASAAAAATAEATAKSAKATAESAKVMAEAALTVSLASGRWLQADGLAAKSTLLLEQPQVALLLAAQAAFQREFNEPVAPSVEGALHRALNATGGTVIALPQAGDGPNAVAISSDGQLAVDAEPGVVQVWNPSHPTAVPLRLDEHEGGVRGLAFTPDGKTLVSLDNAGTLRAWDVGVGATGAHTPTVLTAAGEAVWEMALLSNTLATTDADGGVQIRTLAPGPQPRAWVDPSGPASYAVFSRDGRYLVTAVNDYDTGTLQIWDITGTGPVTGPVTGPADITGVVSPSGAQVGSLAASPAGDQVAAGRADGTITIYNLPGLDAVNVLPGPPQQVETLAFLPTPDGLRLAASYADDSGVYLWDPTAPVAGPDTQPTPLALLRGHAGDIRQLATGAIGAVAIVGPGLSGGGGELRIWDSGSQFYEPQALATGLQAIINVALAPGGELAAVVHDGEPQAQLVDLRGEHAPQSVGVAAADGDADGYATAAAFGGDDLLLVSTDKGKLSAWDITKSSAESMAEAPTAVQRWTQPAHTARINDIAVLPSQDRAATVGEDGSVRIWNVQDGTLLAALTTLPLTPLTDVAWGRGGDSVAAAGSDGVIHRWTVADGKELSSLTAPAAPAAPPAEAQAAGEGTGPSSFTSLAFSTDGSHLAASRDDGSILVWDLAHDAAGTTLPKDKPITALAFDDSHVIAAHDDGTISLWYILSPDSPPVQLAGHSGSVNDLLVEEGGTYLVSAGDDGAIQRWILKVDALVETACRGAGRSLTPAERKLYLPRQSADSILIDPCAAGAEP